MSIIIKRPELERFLRGEGRRMLFGRRKTGKTFYARLTLPNYKYYIVRRGGKFFDPEDGEEYDLKVFLKLCNDNTIVDEFHRADPKFFDALQAGQCSKNLVLITSTMHFHKKFVDGPNAPLKGLFSIKKVGLISPIELMAGEIKTKEELKNLIWYQEPTLIGKSMENAILSGSIFARSLIGEILDEEDVTRSKRYDAILESIAAGKHSLSEIANHLYGEGLIEKASTSYITKYIDIMIKTGLIEKMELWGKKKGSYYRHVSALTEMVYYLDAKYDLKDLNLPWGFIKDAVDVRLPFHIERFVERYMAEYFGMKPVKIQEPEVDVALVKFKKLSVVAEVKWRKEITKKEIRKVEKKLESFSDARKILVVPDKKSIPTTDLEVWDVGDMKKHAIKFMKSF